ncbi:tail fiber protein [Bilophila wadsworthia]|uniref:tail fiber protein n=1 Tax=Bilophila wadsworthia TaxID=35833 RepID=UPI0032209FAE
MPTLNLGQVRPVYRGAWNSIDTYVAYDFVIYNGSAYLALKDVPANYEPPSQTEYWVLFGAKGEPGSPGADGADGAPGERGPSPAYRWDGTFLSIQNPDGTFPDQGVNLQGPAVPLSNSVTSTSETDAASSKAVNTVYNLANTAHTLADTAYDLADSKQNSLGFTPVQQGGAPGQVVGSKVRIGWDGTGITAYIDDTRFPLVTSSAGYTKAPYSSVADSVVSIVAAKGYSVPVVGGASAAVPPGDTWTIVCLYWIQDTGLSDVSVIGTVPGGTLVSSGNQIPANVSKLFLLCWRV